MKRILKHFQKILKDNLRIQHKGFNKGSNKFLDRVFELLINNPYPVQRFSYWKHLNSEYTTDFETFKKYKKLTKYQIEPLINEGTISEVDEFLMSFSPNKKQFEFLKTILKQELDLKAKYKEGIQHWLKAKDIFENAQIESFSGVKLVIRSEFFSQQQLKDSAIKGIQKLNRILFIFILSQIKIS